MDVGRGEKYLTNNIVMQTDTRPLGGNGTASNNIFWQNGDTRTCSNCKEVNPQFMDAPNHDFRLKAGSPAINTGHTASFEEVCQTFEDLYGVNIRVDFANYLRPVGGGWDIGAFEYGSVPAASGQQPVAGSRLFNISIVPMSRQGVYQLMLNQAERADVVINIVNILDGRFIQSVYNAFPVPMRDRLI
jgi:hypothetical protein